MLIDTSVDKQLKSSQTYMSTVSKERNLVSSSNMFAGMSIVAERYPDDRGRSKAMGIALGGAAVGILGTIFFPSLYARFLISMSNTASD